MNIQIKKLNKNAILPYHGSEESAGYDLCALLEEPIDIKPNETVMIHTGLAMSIPNGYFGACYPRSGLASKKGLRLANCVGVVDADYRGEVMIPLHNDSNEIQTIYNGDRLCQMIIQPFMKIEWEEVEALEETNRGTGGFGSTGVKI